MKIAVIGMGKIGLPLAVQFATRDHEVMGVDINQQTVDLINHGREPFPGEAQLQEHLDRLVPAGKLRATADYAEAIPHSDVVVVVVPLFVDDAGHPDFDWMDSATRDIGRHLTTDTLICYETTLPVGTTRTRWKPMLEETSRLSEGKDFHVVFSPERVLTGRVFEDLRKYPKIVGALSAEGAHAARAFYESSLTFDDRADLPRPNGVWDIGSAEAAELVKLAETTYRDVNIGLANQFAVFAESVGINVHEVIAAANSQPYSHIHTPGIAVGGHCIPVYPRLYLEGDPTATIVAAARAANAQMPQHAIARLENAFGSLRGSTVAILGATYRPGVKECAFSGVFDLARGLAALGARPVVHDPMYSDDELRTLGLDAYRLGDEVDAAILHTAHEQFQGLSARELPGVRVIVDGRNSLAAEKFENAVLINLGAGEVASIR